VPGDKKLSPVQQQGVAIINTCDNILRSSGFD